MPSSKTKNSTLSAISLFSGAGGMDIGFSKAGFDIVIANELNKNAAETYKANFKHKMVIQNIDESFHEFENLKDITCVFGGPPCQGFSVAGKMDLNDPRSKLVMSFMKVVELTKPECFVMENVKALATLSKFESFRQELMEFAEKLGYSAQILLVNSKDFNVPQARQRMFFIGFKGNHYLDLSERIKKFQSKKELTAKDALSKLGAIDSPLNPSTCNAAITLASSPVMRRSPYAGMIFNGMGRPIDPNKPCQTLPASMGGNKTPIIDERQFWGDGYSWIEDYHSRLISGESIAEFASAPNFLKRITVSQAKVLHSFPVDYIFKGPKSSIYTQIGNAVPCNLANAIAKLVIDFMRDPSVPPKGSQQRLSLQIN
jgi:DNA (cytosine-5)-methyltransferase 1